MTTQIITTKLFIPSPRPELVSRPRLLERLESGLATKLTLITAQAGFGKTTLLSEWISQCGKPVCWLSLDEGDNDLQRFLKYFIAALQRVNSDLGENVLVALQSPKPQQIEVLLAWLTKYSVKVLIGVGLRWDGTVPNPIRIRRPRG